MLAGGPTARNYQCIGMRDDLLLANLGMHLGALDVAPVWVRRGSWLSVDLTIFMIVA